MAIEKPSITVQHAGLFIGPAGWAYKDWNGVVYPTPRARGFHEATYLAEFFDTIEINTSFYHPLQAAHAAKVPDIRRVAPETPEPLWRAIASCVARDPSELIVTSQLTTFAKVPARPSSL